MSNCSDTSSIPSCPVCDYERGNAGRPTFNGSHMVCLDCDATWRELSETNATPFFAVRSQKPFEQTRLKNNPINRENMSAWVGANGQPTKRHGYKMRGGNYSAFYTAGIAGIAFLFCLAASVSMLQSLSGNNIDHTLTGSIAGHGLEISNVTVDEKVRQNGSKVFTIKGMVSNPASNAHTIPRIRLALKNDQGSELFHWRYSPSVTTLSAGNNLWFSSSITYDTPLATHAEAAFE